jgi:uncharacterized membrane protein YhhN
LGIDAGRTQGSTRRNNITNILEDAMNYFFFLLALLIGLVDWIAVAKKWRTLEYIAKPATMLALIAFLIFNGGLSFDKRTVGMVWFILGIILSLAGDVFLMLPKEQFLAGLVSFLLAHVCYIIGLNPIPPLKTPHILVALLIAVLVALPAVQLYRRIAAGLQAGGKAGLKRPVMVYTIVISIMLASALFTMLRNTWNPWHAISVSGGAALFFLSDAILAWNRFVSPIKNGRLMNMFTYHMGQAFIALGAALHFLL